MLACNLMWIANSFVIGVTAALFLLWFRYMCSLLMAAPTSLDRSEEVARANSLSFAEVLRGLNSASASREQMDGYVVALDRDFEIVTYLLRHMGQSPLVESPSEAWMLKADYRIQHLWYCLARPVSSETAARQVTKMALIVCHFADLVGERSVPARI